jgi:hypothetical protein
MRRSRQNLAETLPKLFNPSQAEALVDLLDSAGSVTNEAPKPRDRYVVVGGQMVVGGTANEKAPVQVGGQVNAQEQVTNTATDSMPAHLAASDPHNQYLLKRDYVRADGVSDVDSSGQFVREKGQWVAYSPFDPSGLQTEIDALEADVAAIDLELDGKAPLVHTHDQYAFQEPIDDGKLLSGFADNANITVSYDSAQRRITLTHPSGSIRYHYRGKEKTLASPWTSSAHSNTSGNWFLYSEDGDTFFWSNVAWKFEDVMVSYVRKGLNLNFALRETHGLMDPNAHRIAHANIGTYVVSGGTLTAGTYAIGGTASDANNTPGLDATVISDEDILTTIPALAEGSYRAVYPVTATDFGFSDLARPFSVGASYIQWYNGTVATEGATGKYFVVYAIGLPTTADAASQLNRWLWTVPQKQYDTLAQAQASTLADVNLCDLALGITEYIPRVKLIYGSNASYMTAGKVRLEDATYLVKGTSATAVATGTTTSWNNLADIPEAIAAIDNLPPAADKLAYYTGANTAALTTFTAFMRTLLDDADAATARATLGAGTVSSVALTATGPLSVGGSPVTGSGTLALTWSGSSANLVRADGSVVASSSFQPAGSYAPAVAGGYLPLSGGTMTGHLLGSVSYNIGATANWWGSGFFTVLNVQNNPVWHSGNFTPGNYQPLDSDLTAIAALATTAYGRGFLPLADAAAARTYIGAQAAGSYQPLDADLTAVAALTTTGFVRRTAADTWSASAMAWADISGIISYGSSAGTVCQGNDSRLSDARTPTAHVLDSATHTISGKTAGQVLLATGATTYAFTGISGDATLAGTGALTLASTITAAGPVGGAATVPVITFDAKGRLTAVTTAAITPDSIGAATSSHTHSEITTSRIAAGCVVTDSDTWVTRKARGNHFGRIFGVSGAPGYFNYVMLTETVNGFYSAIGFSSSNGWTVIGGQTGENSTYNTLWHTGNLTGTRNEHNHSGVYQPLDADLTAVASLTGTGFVRRTATDTWSASALVAADLPSISLTGEATGSGASGSIAVTLTTASVTGKVLTGLPAVSNSAIAATDSILAAMAKLQGQINDKPSISFSRTEKTFFAAPNAANGAASFRLIVASDLPTSGVTAGAYGSASVVPVPTVDAYGRVTGMSTATITPAAIGAQVAGSYGIISADNSWLGSNSFGLASLATWAGFPTVAWFGKLGHNTAQLNGIACDGLSVSLGAVEGSRTYMYVGGVEVASFGLSASFSSRCTQAGYTVWDAGNLQASSSTPSALGTAAPGSSANYSRADHVHAMPTAAQVGAAPAVAGGYLPLSGGTMTGHLLGGTSYNIGATANWWGSGFFTVLNVQNYPVWHSGNFTPGNYALASSVPLASSTTPAALGTAAVGTGTTWARADHVHAMPTAAQVGAATSDHNHNGWYQPIEDQRLRTTDYVVFDSFYSKQSITVGVSHQNCVISRDTTGVAIISLRAASSMAYVRFGVTNVATDPTLNLTSSAGVCNLSADGSGSFGNAKVGTYAPGSTYAEFSHKDVFGSATSWGLVQSASGYTALNCASDQSLVLARGSAAIVSILPNNTEFSDPVRFMSTLSESGQVVSAATSSVNYATAYQLSATNNVISTGQTPMYWYKVQAASALPGQVIRLAVTSTAYNAAHICSVSGSFNLKNGTTVTSTTGFDLSPSPINGSIVLWSNGTDWYQVA